MSKRWWLWGALLGLGAWLALFGDKSPVQEGVALSLPTTRAQSPAARTGHTPQETLLALVPRSELIANAQNRDAAQMTPTRDLFSTRNWNPPLPPPPVIAATPVAPAVPFSFLGKKLEGGAWEVYLGRGEQTLIVREGQVLDSTYRVDKIDPPSLALTYLPLGQVQLLPIGDTR